MFATQLHMIRVQRYRWDGRTMVPDASTFTFAPSAVVAAERWAKRTYGMSFAQLGSTSQYQDGEHRITVKGPDFPRFDWITFAERTEPLSTSEVADMALRIITNNVPRDVINAWELTETERADFDYLDWDAIIGTDAGR